MVNSDGTSSLSTNKSAATRMANIQKGAQRAQVLGQEGRASLRNKQGGKAKAAPVKELAARTPPVVPQDVQMPTGGPQMPPEAAQDFHAGAFQDPIERVQMQKFINSAPVKDATSAVRLKNIFNTNNPLAAQDTRPLLDLIKTRLGYTP